MADTRTISQLEAEGLSLDRMRVCEGTVWVPFRMIRETIPALQGRLTHRAR